MYGEIENFRIVSDGCGGFMKQPIENQQQIGFSRGSAPSVAICDLSILYKTKKTR